MEPGRSIVFEEPMDPAALEKCLRFEELASKQELSVAEWNEFDALTVWITQHEAEYREFCQAREKASHEP